MMQATTEIFSMLGKISSTKFLMRNLDSHVPEFGAAMRHIRRMCAKASGIVDGNSPYWRRELCTGNTSEIGFMH